MFAANYFGVTPDIIVLGKGLGAGLPLACIIMSDKLEGFSPDTEELHTFANPTLSMVTAAKQLAMLESGVLENCREMGKYLGGNIKKMMKELLVNFEKFNDKKSSTFILEKCIGRN